MSLTNRSLGSVLLALMIFSVLLYSYYEVSELKFSTKRINSKPYRSAEEECSTYLPNGTSSPGVYLQPQNLLQSSNNCSKDYTFPNNTGIYNRSFDTWLRKMDLSEKVDCDISCQNFIQTYRKMHTRLACSDNWDSRSIWDHEGNLRKHYKGSLHHFYSIENSSLIFCYIPKNGCTAWKRILLTVTGDIDSPSFETEDIHRLFNQKMRSLKSYTVEEAQIRLKTYKKFLFVREPLERLLSLFLDKAVKEGRIPFSERQFEDFLWFITEKRNRVGGFDEHWAHASSLCFPCDISYDFIGRLETAKRDTQYIFDHFIDTNRDRLMMYREPGHATNSSDPDKKQRYYGQVGKVILSKVIDKYHLDYALFNYDKPFLQPLGVRDWILYYFHLTMGVLSRTSVI